MCPQFTTGASIIGIEIDGVAKENLHMASWVSISYTAVDISHLPCGVIGGVMCPQFNTCASIIGREIDGVANEEVHVISKATG